MDKLVYLLPVLGCAAMMGVMVWMMRGHAGHGTVAAPPDPATLDEIAMLRAEIAALRAAQDRPADAVRPDQAGQRGG